jgi:hypothetical protein
MIATQRRALILYLLQEHGVITIAGIAAPERLALSQRGIEVVVAEDALLPPANGRAGH